MTLLQGFKISRAVSDSPWTCELPPRPRQCLAKSTRTFLGHCPRIGDLACRQICDPRYLSPELVKIAVTRNTLTDRWLPLSISRARGVFSHRRCAKTGSGVAEDKACLLFASLRLWLRFSENPFPVASLSLMPVHGRGRSSSGWGLWNVNFNCLYV